MLTQSHRRRQTHFGINEALRYAQIVCALVKQTHLKLTRCSRQIPSSSLFTDLLSFSGGKPAVWSWQLQASQRSEDQTLTSQCASLYRRGNIPPKLFHNCTSAKYLGSKKLSADKGGKLSTSSLTDLGNASVLSCPESDAWEHGLRSLTDSCCGWYGEARLQQFCGSDSDGLLVHKDGAELVAGKELPSALV